MTRPITLSGETCDKITADTLKEHVSLLKQNVERLRTIHLQEPSCPTHILQDIWDDENIIGAMQIVLEYYGEKS